MNSLKAHYQSFLSLHPGKIFLTAHSHHFWPDCTLQAQQEYWWDAARYIDDKWEKAIFPQILKWQTQMSKFLPSTHAASLTFAPNTHYFIVNLLADLVYFKKPQVLTSDSEFHSFSRQIQRLAEDNLVDVDRVSTLSDAHFSQRFLQQASQGQYDLIFLSHVFFNSGLIVPHLDQFIKELRQLQPTAKIVIDTYHSFMAINYSYEKIISEVYLIGGGYKYAQGGEGWCWMHLPPQAPSRPILTGWMSSFESLEHPRTPLHYSDQGLGYLSSTFEASALYRQVAVFDWMISEALNVETICQYTEMLKQAFAKIVVKTPLLPPHLVGNFLTYEFSSLAEAEKKHHLLREKNVFTDRRMNRIRIGFPPYYDLAEIEQAARLFNQICLDQI